MLAVGMHACSFLCHAKQKAGGMASTALQKTKKRACMCIARSGACVRDPEAPTVASGMFSFVWSPPLVKMSGWSNLPRSANAE